MKISIVTPNYNYADYISDTIRSVVTQDYPNIEHIIIDDGSTDHSMNVIQAWKRRYPQIICATHQKNEGQTPAINVGLRKVTGDIIGWINSDDLFEPETFKRVALFFQTHPKTDILFGDANVVDDNLNFIWRIRHLPFNYRMGAYLGFSRMVTSNAIFWRKEIMGKCGLLREDLKWNMDGEFYSRLMHEAHIARLPFPLANFRQQPQAKSSITCPEWNTLQRREVQAELDQSFQHLPRSRWFPNPLKGSIRLFYKLRRIISRIFRGHYLLQTLERKRYEMNHKSV